MDAPAVDLLADVLPSGPTDAHHDARGAAGQHQRSERRRETEEAQARRSVRIARRRPEIEVVQRLRLRLVGQLKVRAALHVG